MDDIARHGIGGKSPPDPIDQPIALNIDEACKSSRLSRGTLYAAIKSGELPLLKLGRRSLILRDDLLAWLQSKRQRQAA
jgi:excisionase family DNA binding protein